MFWEQFPKNAILLIFQISAFSYTSHCICNCVEKHILNTTHSSLSCSYQKFSNIKTQYFKIFVITSNHLAELGCVLAVCSVARIHTPFGCISFQSFCLYVHSRVSTKLLWHWRLSVETKWHYLSYKDTCEAPLFLQKSCVLQNILSYCWIPRGIQLLESNFYATLFVF